MLRCVETGVVLLVLALPVEGVVPTLAQEPGISAIGTDTSTAATAAGAEAENDAAAGTESPAESAAESNQRKRNAIILAMLVAGIALTGLLLVIVAIVVRGFLRKMARESEAKRAAELVLPPDVAATAAEAASAGEIDESVPFSERETEVT